MDLHAFVAHAVVALIGMLALEPVVSATEDQRPPNATHGKQAVGVGTTPPHQRSAAPDKEAAEASTSGDTRPRDTVTAVRRGQFALEPLEPVPANEFDVTRYGAKCDWDGATGTDDAPSIQAAVTAATAVGGAVLIPRACKINTPVILKSAIKIHGIGSRVSMLVAGAAMEAVILVEENRVGSNGFFEFLDVALRGNGIALNGIEARTISHSKFNRIRVTGTREHALWIGWGWCNDIVDVTLTDNAGDGVYGDEGGQLNALNILRSKIFKNAGFGVHIVGQSAGVFVVGNTLEQNRKGGIFLEKLIRTVRIADNYFEGNGEDGQTFRTPAVTVKSEILLNGGSGTALGRSSPSTAVVIEANYFYTNVARVAAYAGGAQPLRFAFNTQGYHSGTIPALGYWGQHAYASALDVTYEGNAGFRDSPDVIGGYPAQGDPIQGFHSWRDPTAPPRNYLRADIGRHSELARRGGRWIRSGVSFRGWPVYQLVGADANSSTFGVVVDVDEHQELRGKLMYIAAWVKASKPQVMAARVFASQHAGASTQAYVSDANWRFVSLYFYAPASGVFTAGFEKIGAVGTSLESAYFAMPAVAVVGAHYDDFWRDGPPRPLQWSGASPPSGVYQQGDITWNTNATAGGPPGWMCVVETCDRPGEWKAMARLER